VEPEIATPVSSKKKFLIIALVVLVAVVVALGYLFMQKDTPPQTPEPEPAVVVVPREIPRPLSDEEKKLIEARVQSSSTTPTLSKKEKTSIEQKVNSTAGYSPLTEEEKASIEERITIQ